MIYLYFNKTIYIVCNCNVSWQYFCNEKLCNCKNSSVTNLVTTSRRAIVHFEAIWWTENINATVKIYTTANVIYVFFTTRITSAESIVPTILISTVSFVTLWLRFGQTSSSFYGWWGSKSQKETKKWQNGWNSHRWLDC